MEKVNEGQVISELLKAMYQITQAEDPKDMYDIAEEKLKKYQKTIYYTKEK